MMARYIDADKEKEIVNNRSSHWLNEWNTLGVLAVIDETPTADVEEVRHGKWVLKNGYITCSECGCEPYALARRIDFDNLHHYCPNCGAKMDGGEE